MRRLSLGLAAAGGLSTVLGIAVWVAQTHAEEETSVLVQTPTAPPIDVPTLELEAPVVAPPALGPSLPPPADPRVELPAVEPAKPVINQPFMRPAVPRGPIPAKTALQINEEPMPAPDVPAEIQVRPTPPIEYDTDGDARRMYRKSGQIELVMLTEDPADHCVYEIPLCVPGCCVDEPVVSSGQGIFGRGVVEYCWPSCGFRAIVKFRHVLGDVRVDYEGD